MGYLDPPEPDDGGEICAETQVELGQVDPWAERQELSYEEGDCWRCPIMHRCKVGQSLAKSKMVEVTSFYDELYNSEPYEF